MYSHADAVLDLLRDLDGDGRLDMDRVRVADDVPAEAETVREREWVPDRVFNTDGARLRDAEADTTPACAGSECAAT
jgi:hypothetical protein